MLERVRYVNSRGESMDFGAAGIYVNENDLRDWEWTYSTEHNRIRGLSHKLPTKTLPIKIWSDTDDEGTAIKNRLHDLTEVDVVAGTPGRLYVGEWYQYCYVVKSEKSGYLTSRRILSIDLTLAVESGPWYCSQLETYGDQTGLESAVVGDALVGFAQVGAVDNLAADADLSYPYDYPTDYAVSGENNYLVNDCVAPCAWKITIQGPAANPSITIGEDVHRLHYEIPPHCYVEIDSRERTITLTNALGETSNLFRYRDKEEDIFARIDSGTHWLRWNGEYNFTVELYKERSEPLWT